MNAAIDVAVVPYGSHVRVLDLTRVFTPGRALPSLDDRGERRIVRRPDGIHLSDAGAEVAGRFVLSALRRDYGER